MKATAAIKTISDSSKVQNYLISLRTHSHYPASNDIVILLNSMSYFMFKNSETMCLAALTIANFGFSQYETLIKSIDDKIKTRIIIEIMIKCSNMKIVKTGRFFDRYFESLS
ncbi:hypothetical protein [uncultured Mucilaginibacter sp.]|uniref:hypothetical protein n=1 Tax=uncultured Mucilaginibacter sp. TaxID=797541 RepID=UPI0026368D82|nr:hypothetical protein [uncultured Mucilaginibacter sp.]